MAVIQSIAPGVGAASRMDLQTAVTRNRGPVARWSLLISIVTVNIVTIAADLEGGAAAVGLIFHQDWRGVVAPPSVPPPSGPLLLRSPLLPPGPIEPPRCLPPPCPPTRPKTPGRPSAR